MNEEMIRKLLKEALSNHPTKDDVRQIVREEIEMSEKRVTEDIGNQINNFANELNETKSDKLPVISVTQRVTELEKKVFHN